MYGQIESPRTAALLGELDGHWRPKRAIPKLRLKNAMEVIEQSAHKKEAEKMKQVETDDDNEYLRKKLGMVAQKGGNQRSGGIT